MTDTTLRRLPASTMVNDLVFGESACISQHKPKVLTVLEVAVVVADTLAQVKVALLTIALGIEERGTENRD
jgi:hypothetical protein